MARHTPEVTESKVPHDIMARQLVDESRRGIHSLVVQSWDQVLQPDPGKIRKNAASGYHSQHSGIYERNLKRNNPLAKNCGPIPSPIMTPNMVYRP